jgi:uncharacterized RDD family membrane protein YckC
MIARSGDHAAGNGSGTLGAVPRAVTRVNPQASARAQAAAAARFAVAVREPSAPRDYTGLVTRTIAFAIDAIVIELVALGVAGVVALALSVLSLAPHDRTTLLEVGGTLKVLWTVAYFVTFWSTTGQTPGARVMRFRVIPADGDGGPLPPRRALVRFAGMVLAAIPLFAGYLLVLVDDRRRGLHDRLARTVVVDAPEDRETAVARGAGGKPG